jgi:hypothetical protein
VSPNTKHQKNIPHRRGTTTRESRLRHSRFTVDRTCLEPTCGGALELALSDPRMMRAPFEACMLPLLRGIVQYGVNILHVWQIGPQSTLRSCLRFHHARSPLLIVIPVIITVSTISQMKSRSERTSPECKRAVRVVRIRMPWNKDFRSGVDHLLPSTFIILLIIWIMPFRQSSTNSLASGGAVIRS